MIARFFHHKCKQLGLRVVEAKCLRFVGTHHPAPSKIRSIFTSDVRERLQIAGLIVSQSGSHPDSYWRLTRKGAALLRKVVAAHTQGAASAPRRMMVNR